MAKQGSGLSELKSHRMQQESLRQAHVPILNSHALPVFLLRVVDACCCGKDQEICSTIKEMTGTGTMAAKDRPDVTIREKRKVANH